MAKSDHGYVPARRSSGGGGGGGRGRSRSTYIKETKKEDLIDLWIRTQLRGILDLTGEEATSDKAMQIEEGLVEEIRGKKDMTKADIAMAADKRNPGYQAFLANQYEVAELESAEILIDALQSKTRSRDRDGLDEGDVLDDPVALTVEGSGGWGDEIVGEGTEYRKHVTVAVDNSGSTHMPETGFCSRAMASVANKLMEVLYTAAGEYPGVTWDSFTFNRVAEQHSGHRGQENRAELVRQSLSHIYIDDPLKRDATQTNLAPLIQAMLENEEERGLIGSPRLDIILTDGEFESQKDADMAGELQRQRGPGVISYVLNLCPENPSEVALPHQFRVIPLDCIVEEREYTSGLISSRHFYKRVDSEALRVALMRIVIDEVERDS